MPFYSCPVCGYGQMPYPAARHEICPSCGTQFGYDDCVQTHRALRNAWLETGGPWFSPVHPRPEDWNPFLQVIRAGYEFDVPVPSPRIKNTVVKALTAGAFAIL
jgi:hypothetical protein